MQLAWDGLVKLHTARKDVWDLKQTQWRKKQQNEFARHFDKHEERTEESEGLKQNLEEDKKEEVKESDGMVMSEEGKKDWEDRVKTKKLKKIFSTSQKEKRCET